MTNKLPHVKPPKDWNLKTNQEYYEIIVEDLQNHPYLEKIQHMIEQTGDYIKINKDKTHILIFNNFGDETVIDMETGKIINYDLGF